MAASLIAVSGAVYWPAAAHADVDDQAQAVRRVAKSFHNAVDSHANGRDASETVAAVELRKVLLAESAFWRRTPAEVEPRLVDALLAVAPRPDDSRLRRPLTTGDLRRMVLGLLARSADESTGDANRWLAVGINAVAPASGGAEPVTLGGLQRLAEELRRGPLVATGDPSLRDWRTGRTALHVAAMTNSPRLMAALLAAGGDVGARDRSGNTPLHAAVVGNDPVPIKMLLESGAELEARNSQAQTPLLYGAWHGSDFVNGFVPVAVQTLDVCYVRLV